MKEFENYLILQHMITGGENRLSQECVHSTTFEYTREYKICVKSLGNQLTARYSAVAYPDYFGHRF